MGINSGSRRDSFDFIPPTKQKCKLWDPIATLDVINPDRGCLTCVGYAPSCGRRCRNPINQANRASAFALLETLSYIDTSTIDITEMLRKLARLTLCVRYHQGQNSDMIRTWSKQIDQQQKSKYREELHPLDRHETKGAAEFAVPLYTGQRYRKQDDQPSMLEELARMQEELARMLEELARSRREEEARKRKEREEKEQKKEREEKERKKYEEEEERKKCEEEKERKKCEEEKERKKCEEEKQRKREQEARDKETREREERNERIRQRAEQARKERERKAKEQAERERKEWDASWLRYVLQWDDLKKQSVKGTSEKLQEIIPWPVKSGDCKDVSESAIEEFFRKATPEDTDAEKMYALMKMECLKWHADRIPRMFGEIEDKTLATLFNTVARIVIKIRQETGQKLGR